MHSSQSGVGLIEVLVALLLLSVAVLGFAALQIKAVTASVDAGNYIQATNLARDLAERIRINREGFTEFENQDGYLSKITSAQDCVNSPCSATEMARYDFVQVNNKAKQLGMKIAIPDCQGSLLNRKCIYVSWGETIPTDSAQSGTNLNAESDLNNEITSLNCTNGTAYVVGAQCIILEAYNYE